MLHKHPCDRFPTGVWKSPNTIQIGEKTFHSQKAAKDHVRQLLARIGACDRVEAPEDVAMLRALVMRLPHHNSKLKNLQDFSISKLKLNPAALEVNIIRTDNTIRTISWLACVTGVFKSPKTRLLGAFRFAVHSQVQTFRNRSKATITDCDLCGNALNGLFHVDHVNQFEGLVKAFKASVDGSPKFPPLSGLCEQTDGTHRMMFNPADSAYKTAFQSYHRANAILRVLCPSCNLTRDKKRWRRA
ncbi:MAG: hypothetical protein WDW38_006825 [Sanguina aurantia]